MKKGFTLLELIIVIIILGILATIGFVAYGKIIEKGRRAEGAAVLGTIRSQTIIREQESGVIDNAYLNSTLGLPITSACDSKFYFYYTTDATTATATRCIGALGKQPGVLVADNYTMTLTKDGVKGSTPAGLW